MLEQHYYANQASGTRHNGRRMRTNHMRRNNLSPAIRRLPHLCIHSATSYKPQSLHIMTSAPSPLASQPAEMTTTPIAGFRLGEDQFSDASDSDQSADSERSRSPPLADGENTTQSTQSVSKATRSKNRRARRLERKQVRTLTDELGGLLGDAFQTPSGGAVDASTFTQIQLKT
jgi:hypothetical protein